MNTITRPDVLLSTTYKYKFSDQNGDVSLYVTISNLDETPFEVFINCKNAYYAEHLNALMITVSLALRQGIDLSVLASELCDICSPFTGHFGNGGYVNSIYAAIGQVFKRHISQANEEL